jgi:hypothetical protein
MATRSHLADGDRHLTASLLGSPAAVTPAASSTPTNLGGGHGVCGDADLAVTAAGGTRTVSIAPGHAFVRGATNASQGVYNVWNDAATTVAIDNGDGNPRYDLVVVRLRDSDPGVNNTETSVAFSVVKGTPAAAPADPPVPSDGSYLVLARVRVPAGSWTTVLSTMIDDLRPMANSLGGVRRIRSTNRPTTNISRGDLFYEVDTGYVVKWNGSAWQYQTANMTVNASSNAWPSNAAAGQLALNTSGQYPNQMPAFFDGTTWRNVGNVRWASSSGFDSPAVGVPGTATTQTMLQVQTGTVVWSAASPLNANGEAPIFWPEAFKNGVAGVWLAWGDVVDFYCPAPNGSPPFAGFFPTSKANWVAYGLARSGCTVRLRFNDGVIPNSAYQLRLNFLAVGF